MTYSPVYLLELLGGGRVGGGELLDALLRLLLHRGHLQKARGGGGPRPLGLLQHAARA